MKTSLSRGTPQNVADATATTAPASATTLPRCPLAGVTTTATAAREIRPWRRMRGSGAAMTEGIRDMKSRTLVTEWWEVWWDKKGERPLRQNNYGESIDPDVPQHGFNTLESAREHKRRQKNRYLKIKHVRRYRVTKAPGQKL